MVARLSDPLPLTLGERMRDPGSACHPANPVQLRQQLSTAHQSESRSSAVERLGPLRLDSMEPSAEPRPLGGVIGYTEPCTAHQRVSRLPVPHARFSQEP